MLREIGGGAGRAAAGGDTPSLRAIARPSPTSPVSRIRLLAPDGGISVDPYPSIRLWTRSIRALPGFIEMPGIHRLHDLKPNRADPGAGVMPNYLFRGCAAVVTDPGAADGVLRGRDLLTDGPAIRAIGPDLVAPPEPR